MTAAAAAVGWTADLAAVLLMPASAAAVAESDTEVIRFAAVTVPGLSPAASASVV
jgi:hypothetical protein